MCLLKLYIVIWRYSVQIIGLIKVMKPVVLLKDYRLEIFNSACDPDAMTVHCHAHLDQDVGPALPYLNSVLGGFEYIKEPPSVTFKAHGKLITVHGRLIAVNALKDAAEAEKIIAWLQREINEAWEKRDTIVPSEKGAGRPQLIEILKLLPKTNCKKCGLPTCMVFAAHAVEGGRGADGCPELSDVNKSRLSEYLALFHQE